jgi:ribulose-5-phosphate 4-epimerase/fuculose-1-phosphate aldolase
MRDEAALRDLLCVIAKSFFDRGMAVGTAGNISVRLDDGYLVTPTNACLGRLEPARLSRLDADWRHVSGDKPTKELFMHRAFYETRATAEAVVHLHSTYATAVSMLPGAPSLDPIPPVSPYYVMRVGHMPLVPYIRPGAEEIGHAIRAFEGRYSSVLLAHHGPVVAGKSLTDAASAADELEETAKLHMLLLNQAPRSLTDAEIGDLVRTFKLDW